MTNKLPDGVPKNLLKKLRGSSANERTLHRLHAVVLVLNGMSAMEAARLYGDSARAVAYWVKHYQKRGLQGLAEGARAGRPSVLNGGGLAKVRKFIKQSERKGAPVSAVALSRFLFEEMEINLSYRQCWRIIKRLKM